MMQYGLTLTSFLERAGKLFPGVEVISRLPDNSFIALPTPTCTAGPVLWGQVCSMLDLDKVTGSRP